MPTNPTKPMMQRYEEAKQALEGIREQDSIAIRLRRVGYGSARIEEGEAVLAAAARTMEAADATLAEQRAATEKLRRVRVQLETSYRDTVQLARVMFEADHPWLAMAGVPRRRAPGAGANHHDNSLDGLLERARTFFRAAQEARPEVQTQLGEMGLGTAAVQMAHGLIGAVEQAREAQQQCMERHNQAVRARSQAFQRLDDWMGDFTTVARVALRDRPHLLAELGLKPRGRPRKTGEEQQASERDR